MEDDKLAQMAAAIMGGMCANPNFRLTCNSPGLAHECIEAARRICEEVEQTDFLKRG